jgi:hypothetical protein
MERLKVLRAKCGLDNPRVPPTKGEGEAFEKGTNYGRHWGSWRQNLGGKICTGSFL